MQKNKIILMLTIGMILSPFLSLHAAEVPTTTKKIDPAKLEEFKTKLKLETEVIKNNLGTSKTEIEQKLAAQNTAKKVRLASKSQEKIRDIIEKIYNKFNVQTGKLSQVDVKISAKISGLVKDGKDVTQINVQYKIAKAALNKASSDILATRMIATEQLTKEISKETIRTLVKSSEEVIKAAGSEYRKLLPMIAQINGTEKVEAEVKTSSKN